MLRGSFAKAVRYCTPFLVTHFLVEWLTRIVRCTMCLNLLLAFSLFVTLIVVASGDSNTQILSSG
jgi:hypothetical protein